MEPWGVQDPVRVRGNLSGFLLLAQGLHRVVVEHLFAIDQRAVEVILESLLAKEWARWGLVLKFQNFGPQHRLLN